MDILRRYFRFSGIGRINAIVPFSISIADLSTKRATRLNRFYVIFDCQGDFFLYSRLSEEKIERHRSFMHTIGLIFQLVEYLNE